MSGKVNLSELKKVITLAEDELERLHDGDRRWLKQRRIRRALNRAYKFLNKKEYTQESIDKMTHIVFRSLQDAPIIWWYFAGTLLAGLVLLASYETYSYLYWHWDIVIPIPWPLPVNPVDPTEPTEPTNPTEPTTRPVTPSPTEPGTRPTQTTRTTTKKPVLPDPNDPTKDKTVVYIKYVESNIVSLYDLLSVDDQEGLLNHPQEFSIKNVSDDLPNGFNYSVSYNINIIELNEGVTNLLNKRYIKYQLTHYDDDGIVVTEKIGRLSDLQQNPDGTFKLYTGTQEKDVTTHFEMRVWISNDATNNEQGKSYTFGFRVSAVVNPK